MIGLEVKLLELFKGNCSLALFPLDCPINVASFRHCTIHKLLSRAEHFDVILGGDFLGCLSLDTELPKRIINEMDLLLAVRHMDKTLLLKAVRRFNTARDIISTHTDSASGSNAK